MSLTNQKKTIWILFFLSITSMSAQTIINGFFPKKNELTIATSYASKSYDNFYRGESLTPGNPANMGEISSSIYSLYGEYGILNWLSASTTAPYISIENETGALDPIQNVSQVEGLQDLNVFLKARVLDKQFENNSKITLGGATGITVPIGGYEAAGILSLGSGATVVDGCGFVQFTTASNLFLELQAVYSLKNSADFDVPNAFMYSAKLGYYNDLFYAHAKIGVQNSLSGFDIGSQEFMNAGGPAALPETEVDYANVYFDIYVPLYKKTLGISSGYALNMEGQNYNKESGFSFGLVYNVQ